MELNYGIGVQVECRYSDYFVCEAPLLTTMKDAIVVKVNGTVVDVQGVEFRQWFTFNEISDFLDVQIIFPRMVLIR